MAAFTDLYAAGQKLISEKDVSGALTLFTALEIDVKEYQLLNSSDQMPDQFFYAKFLALMLLNDDLNAAKYLWKRAPASCKDTASMSFLPEMWAIGKALWLGDIPQALSTISNTNFPPELATLAADIRSHIVKAHLQLVIDSYSSINAEKLATRLVLRLDELLQMTGKLGWCYSPNEGTLRPQSYGLVDVIHHPSVIGLDKNLAMLDMATQHAAEIERRQLVVDLSGTAKTSTGAAGLTAAAGTTAAGAGVSNGSSSGGSGGIGAYNC